MFTVMIVDDYEIYRKELRDMPVWGENTGFFIREEAADGVEALKKLKKEPVHLLLTDIRMPCFDGLELIKEATEQDLCDCILIMSQFSDFEYARKGLSSGALDYLLKPVNQEELLKGLKRAAAHILEKKQTVSVKYLEKMMNNPGGEFFPDDELELLEAYICEGHPNAAVTAAYLADVTFTQLDSGMLKTAKVLTKVLKKIYESVKIEFTWINKFLSPLELDCSKYDEFAKLKAFFVGTVKLLISTISKYELDIENDSLVRVACRSILDNIDSNISINELSSKLFITRTYLSKVFKEKTGMTLAKYLAFVKIEHAKILVTSGMKNFEIAERLGYKDNEYFKKLFKEKTGMSLNEFRSMHCSLT